MFQGCNYFSFSFLIALLSTFFKNICISLCSHVLDIKFASTILDLTRIVNTYNEDITLQ